jgi:hypothetical protein
LSGKKGCALHPDTVILPALGVALHDGGRPHAARELLLRYMTGSGGMCWGLEKLGGGFLKVSGDAAVLCFCWVG